MHALRKLKTQGFLQPGSPDFWWDFFVTADTILIVINIVLLALT